MPDEPRWYPPEPPHRRPDGVLHYSGLSFALLPGYRPLLLDLWVPPADGDVPVAVWVHGGAWRAGDRRHLPPTMPHGSLFERTVRAGLAIATVDYRLSAEAVFPAPLHDVHAAIRYLRRYATVLGLDAARIASGGESAGGHLAALAAVTADGALAGDVGVTGVSGAVRGVAGWYAPYDFRGLPLTDPDDAVAAMLGDGSPVLAERASPAAHVSAATPPFLLLHGEADDVVPVQQSVEMHRMLGGRGVRSELARLPGAGHCFSGYPDIDGLLERTVEFWLRVLA